MDLPLPRKAAQTEAHSGPAEPEAAVVGRYSAVLSLDVERSDLFITDLIAAKSAREVLASDPGYAPWPPRAVGKSLEGASPEYLVTARLKALFDFGAFLPDDAPDELELGMAKRWAKLDAERRDRAAGRRTPNYERIQVSALIRADGDGSWSYSHSSLVPEPLPLPGTAPNGRTELDLYVQNHIRKDLAHRLRAEQ